MKVHISKGTVKDSIIDVGGSKSLTHRYFIAAALAEGSSVLHNIAVNEDTLATMRCLQHLGAVFNIHGKQAVISGIKNLYGYDGAVLDCSESGSTLRFLIPLFSLTGKDAAFTGHGKLLSRPLSVYKPLFEHFDLNDNILTVSGRLKPGKYRIKGNVSSQFITGLLFALPLLDGGSQVEILEPFESRSYAEMTVSVLRAAGITVLKQGNTYIVPGRQRYQALKITVDSDDSQAAFFGVLAAVTGRKITLEGIGKNSVQGDHFFIDILKKSRCWVSEMEKKTSVQGLANKPFVMSLADCPDLGPAMFVLASCLDGPSVFSDPSRLKLKESDRIGCMQEELAKAGYRLQESEGIVIISGHKPAFDEVVFDSHNDHRIAMALSILAAANEKGAFIENAEAVNKSYPEFFEHLKATGVEVQIYDQQIQ